MADINSERFNRAESYGKFREWAERLKNFEGVPEMYRNIPSYPESLTEEYNRLNNPSASESAQADFLNRHLDYLADVKRKIQLTDPGYLRLQQLISNESQDYPGGAFSVGLDPGAELNLFNRLTPEGVKTFRKSLLTTGHELLGHLRPALLGIQPSRDPVTVPGLRGEYKPSIVSPSNEALAIALNNALVRNLGVNPETVDPKYPETLRTTRFPYHSFGSMGSRRKVEGNPAQVADIGAAADAFSNLPRSNKDIYTFPAQHLETYISSPSADFTQQNPYFAPLVSELRKSNFINDEVYSDPLNIPEAARSSISRSLLNKYVNPTLRNVMEGVRISTPGWDKYLDSPSAANLTLNPLQDDASLLSQKLDELASFDLDKNYSPAGLMIFNRDPISSAVSGAVEGLKRNTAGAAGGAAMALLNDKVAEALAKDDYKTAATEAVKDVALGAATETGLRQVAAPLAQRIAPAAAARVAPYVAGAARVGIPAAVGTGLFMQGRSGSALDTLTNKAAEVVPGLRANPKTDLGRKAGKTVSNEAKYFLNSILQNRVPYLDGRLF